MFKPIAHSYHRRSYLQTFLHSLTIADKDNKIYYQLDGQELNDLQTLYFEKGSYIIQIVADDYTEDIISLNYNVKIEN